MSVVESAASALHSNERRAAADTCPPLDDCSGAVDGASTKLAELTCSAPCIPSGVCVAKGMKGSEAEADKESEGEAAWRLAAANRFRINDDEPTRTLAELVQALQDELEGGRAQRQQIAQQQRAQWQCHHREERPAFVPAAR